MGVKTDQNTEYGERDVIYHIVECGMRIIQSEKLKDRNNKRSSLSDKVNLTVSLYNKNIIYFLV